MPEIVSINYVRLLYYVLHFHLDESISEGMEPLFFSHSQVLFRKVLKPARFHGLSLIDLLHLYGIPLLSPPALSSPLFFFFFITYLKDPVKFGFSCPYTPLFLYVCVFFLFSKNLSYTVLCIVLFS